MTPGIAAIFIICFSILLVAGIFKVLEKYPQIGKYIKENLKYILPVALIIITVLFFTMIMNHKQKAMKPGTGGYGTCHYKYSDGSVCGGRTNHYDGLCDYHYSQLYSTYKEFGGKK